MSTTEQWTIKTPAEREDAVKPGGQQEDDTFDKFFEEQLGPELLDRLIRLVGHYWQRKSRVHRLWDWLERSSGYWAAFEMVRKPCAESFSQTRTDEDVMTLAHSLFQDGFSLGFLVGDKWRDELERKPFMTRDLKDCSQCELMSELKIAAFELLHVGVEGSRDPSIIATQLLYKRPDLEDALCASTAQSYEKIELHLTEVIADMDAEWEHYYPTRPKTLWDKRHKFELALHQAFHLHTEVDFATNLEKSIGLFYRDCLRWFLEPTSRNPESCFEGLNEFWQCGSKKLSRVQKIA